MVVPVHVGRKQDFYKERDKDEREKEGKKTNVRIHTHMDDTHMDVNRTDYADVFIQTIK
jgi:hypothetical protein